MEYIYAAMLIHKAGKKVDEATVKKVLEAAGVQDVLTKSLGSSNPHNQVKATLNALLSLVDAKRMAAKRKTEVKELFTV